MTEFLASKMAKFNVVTKTLTEYPIPLPRGLQPAAIRAESPKGTLWFTCLTGSSVGSIDIHTGVVTLLHDPGLVALPSEPTVDSEGNVWYSTIGRGTLNKINVTTRYVFFSPFAFFSFLLSPSISQ